MAMGSCFGILPATGYLLAATSSSKDLSLGRAIVILIHDAKLFCD